MNGNGKVDGNGAAAQQVQVNPAEIARYALVFLSRADFKAAERQVFDLSEQLLRAIAEGRVVLAPAQTQPPVEPATPQPTAPQPERTQ